mmetsp:Transcript_61901/g.114887  ORF Transcript_61901/g.114887 Transcript_61901/m.114887 type:complete len:516 (+) Transcript_61901:75-1622(+)
MERGTPVRQNRSCCWGGLRRLLFGKDKSKADEVSFADKVQLAKALLVEVAACRKAKAAMQNGQHLRSFPGVPIEALKAPRQAPRSLEVAHAGGTGPLIRKDREKGTSGPLRTSFTAMVLPRWESLEVFDHDRLDASKLVMSMDMGLPALVCADCGRLAGAGEAILTLSCLHHFCPQCFEGFLRRQWADLATRSGADLEREQVPCPACGCMLGRPDVHTLNHAELAALARRRRVRPATSPLLNHSGCSVSPTMSRSSLASEVTALAPCTSAVELPKTDQSVRAVPVLQSGIATVHVSTSSTGAAVPLLSTSEDSLRRLLVQHGAQPPVGRSLPSTISSSEACVRGAGLWNSIGEQPPLDVQTVSAWPVQPGVPELSQPHDLDSSWGQVADLRRRSGPRTVQEASASARPVGTAINLAQNHASTTSSVASATAQPLPAQKPIAADAPAPIVPRRVVPVTAGASLPSNTLKAGLSAPSAPAPVSSPSDSHRLIEANLTGAILTGPARRLAAMPMPAAA